MSFWLIAVGLVTLLGQVVLLRVILVASFGSELVYLLAIGLQLLGTALGVMTGRRAVRNGETSVRMLFFVFALLLPVLVAFARGMRVIFGGTPGAYLPFHQQMAGIALVLLPSGIVGGLLFTRVATLYVDRGKTLASAYAIESAGGLAGGISSTVLIAAGVQNLAAAILCSLIAVAAAILPNRRGERPWLLQTGAAIALGLTLSLLASRQIDHRLTALNHPQLLDSRDTPYGRATITGSLGQVVVFENDALAFESQGTSAEEFVHVAALQIRDPRSALVLGGVVDGLIPEVMKHGFERVADVEIDRRLVDMVAPFLPHGVPDSWNARHAVLTYEDPRRAMERPTRYDLILSAMPEPESGQASRFYTREFFDLCARRLSVGGVLAFRLRASENSWTPALARRNGSIVHALRAAFTNVVILPGTVNVVVASNSPLVTDPDILSARLRERKIETRLVSSRYLNYLYTNDRKGEIERAVAAVAAPENSDARPVCYQYTLVLWLSKFFPSLGQFDFGRLDPMQLGARPRGAAFIIATLAIGALMLVRRSIVMRRTLLVAIAGFTGMLLECSVILRYQMSSGVLYQDLGLLLTMFMSGLALGSWALDRADIEDRSHSRNGIALLVAIAVLSCLTAFSFMSGTESILAASALLLLAAGLLTGGLFAFASLRHVESQARVVAPLYAADLLGGCLASISGSLFLIPVLGLPATALLVGLLALLAMMIV